MTLRTAAVARTVAAGLLLAAATAPVVVVGQSRTAPGWTHPKTPWGDPDIQGIWPTVHMSGTPLQRNPQLGEKAFYTDEEMAERIRQFNQRNSRYDNAVKAGNVGAAIQAAVTDPGTPQRQTSMIMEPANGRLPELTEEGKRRSALMKSSWTLPGEKVSWDAPEDFDSWDRCITRGLPASMFPFRYNNGMRIFQAPGYVVLNMEMIHEDRIIPVDGRPALPAVHKQWMGESRGRWEGDTLVVVTTNFNGRTPVVNYGTEGTPPGNRLPTSEGMKLTERFTRVSADTIDYEITVEDPLLYQSSWTAKFPLKQAPDYEWWEYACHEGNRGIRDFITSSRAERAAEAQGGQPAAAPAQQQQQQQRPATQP